LTRGIIEENFGFRISDFGLRIFEISVIKDLFCESKKPTMIKEELKNRTKKFALMIIRLVDDLPNTKAGNTIGNQIIRAGTSVAANYRSACRARSSADFISKVTIVEEECDESLFWLELILESKLVNEERLSDLIREADELTAIYTASGRTARQSSSKNSFKKSK
jgi:four helix bundle protein